MGKGDRTDRAARIIQWREGVSYDGWASARALQNIAATVRPDLLSQGSYVAPSPQRRIPCKRHETELTCCPVYDFKPRAIYTKGLTPAIFCNITLSQEGDVFAWCLPIGQCEGEGTLSWKAARSIWMVQ